MIARASAPPERSSAALWIVLLAIAAVVGLALFVVLAAAALFALSAEPSESAPPAPSATPALAPSAVRSMRIEANVVGARVFVGERLIGVTPVQLDASHLSGEPLVVIAPGHRPAVVAADQLAPGIARAASMTITLMRADRPHRVVLVRHPRPAAARVAFTNEPLGPVPGIIVVPPPAVGDLAPQIELVEAGYPALRISTAHCDVASVCVLAGGPL